MLLLKEVKRRVDSVVSNIIRTQMSQFIHSQSSSYESDKFEQDIYEVVHSINCLSKMCYRI